MGSNFAQAHAALKDYWPSDRNGHRQSLEFMRDMMRYLGNPQDKLKVIHVAGTSGKSSTAHYIAALLTAAGHKVGLTVSPHVDEINERVQINMRPLPEAEFCQSLDLLLAHLKKGGFKPNYFELFIAMAFCEFAKQRVDYAVVEVGIGGLLDSTNIVDRTDKVCVIADIGLDHTKLLGDTLGEIAQQKAGIIQLHNTVFCYKQGKSVMDAFTAMARRRQADLHILDKTDHANFDFLPLYQKRNFGLALQVAAYAERRDTGRPLPKQAVSQAAATKIPNRFEVHKLGNKTVVLDAAHNPQKVHALMASLSNQFGALPTAALFAVTDSGRRFAPTFKELSGCSYIIITKIEDDPKKFASKITKTNFGVIEDPQKAFQALLQRPEPVLVVTGSFYLLNYIRPLLKDYVLNGLAY